MGIFPGYSKIGLAWKQMMLMLTFNRQCNVIIRIQAAGVDVVTYAATEQNALLWSR